MLIVEDYVRNEYTNVPLDLAERVKARAKGVDGISIKAVLMPHTKVRKRLIIDGNEALSR